MIPRSSIFKVNNISHLFLIIFPVFSFSLYYYVGFNIQVAKAIYFGFVIISLLVVFPLFLKKEYLYGNLILDLIILMIVTIIISFLFWGQGLLLGFRSTAPYLAIIYFFLLLKFSPNIKFVENLIWFFCIIYICFWLYGLFKAPELVFGLDEDKLTDSRGIFRLSIPGSGIVHLSFFLAVSRYVETRKIKWLYIFSLLFIVIFLHVIRQYIFFSFSVAIIYILFNTRYLWIGIVLSLVFLLVGFNFNVDSDSVFGKLITLSEQQANDQNSGEENTRIQEYRFFFTEYDNNPLGILFGNGVSHSESSFGKYESRINEEYEFYLSDVGYAEIFIRFGLFGLFIYLFIFYRIINQNVPIKYKYAKLYLIFLILTNLLSSSVTYSVIMFSISLYVLECTSKTYQYK
ncbi:hypothetical protein [uncultured Algoriphagus sp.]|uniref:hypothetical protein n=1 Tax=uncultured Algoriphagus sp. TaxID=417365 RepID=UPI0030EF75EB|tara:strand:+ start:25081 stop:26286 length:1206 start_codon:yes stop_codon:yes gene_type:complete